jgi:hypothetical protein
MELVHLTVLMHGHRPFKVVHYSLDAMKCELGIGLMSWGVQRIVELNGLITAARVDWWLNSAATRLSALAVEVPKRPTVEAPNVSGAAGLTVSWGLQRSAWSAIREGGGRG